MELNEYQQELLDKLVEFVKDWASDDTEYNGIIRDEYLVEFVSDLQTKIYDEVSMNGKRGQTLLLYTGQSAETGNWIWQKMENFCANN